MRLQECGNIMITCCVCRIGGYITPNHLHDMHASFPQEI